MSQYFSPFFFKRVQSTNLFHRELWLLNAPPPPPPSLISAERGVGPSHREYDQQKSSSVCIQYNLHTHNYKLYTFASYLFIIANIPLAVSKRDFATRIITLEKARWLLRADIKSSNLHYILTLCI